MNFVLLGKEIRHHAAVFLVLFLLNAAGGFLIGRATSASGVSGSILAGSSFTLLTLLTIASAVVAHRLVVVEFQKKTNLFLEALPLPRWRMLLTKLLFGWSVVLASAVAVLLLAWLLAASDGRTPRFLAILLSRTLLWATFIYAFFFLTSFLGRYRVPFYLVLGFTLLWFTSGSLLRPGQFPPFALIDPNHFGFERDQFPARDLAWTALISGLLFLAALLLGLAREGSVAAMLGERMSHRERLFFGGAFFVFVSVPSLVDHHRPAAFHLPGALEEESRGVRVLFSPEDPAQPVDRELALAASLTATLAEERDWLGIPASKWPPVFVVERPRLESGGGLPYEAGNLEKDEGCLVYADYRQASFPDQAFAHFVVRQCLRVYSRERIDHEGKRWVFEGLQLVRQLRAAPREVQQEWVQRASQALHQHPLSAASLAGWDHYEELAGEDPAHALSWHLLQTLRDHAGEERFRRFVIAALGPPVPARDVRAVVRDRLHPTARVFARTIGISLPDFVTFWKNQIPPVPAPPEGSPPSPVPP